MELINQARYDSLPDTHPRYEGQKVKYLYRQCKDKPCNGLWIRVRDWGEHVTHLHPENEN